MITHPSDDILFKYASGTLDPALQLLVSRHIALDPQSAQRLASFQTFGGMLLAAETPAPMTAGSLDRALARIVSQSIAPEPMLFPSLDTLSWRWAGPGRAIAPIDVPGSALRTYALRISPGKNMLQHGHGGQEWTLIVQGAYRDEGGEYHAGAFIEEDEDTQHKPVAIGDVECICLAVMTAPLTAPGVMGRIAQYLMR